MMTFLEFCVKVRKNDPSILPELGSPFKILSMCKRQHIELADALLENTSVTYLELESEHYTEFSAKKMAKYVRTSKHLQHIHWIESYRRSQQRERKICCFLLAIQHSVSLQQLDMHLPSQGRPSSLALQNMLTHTQSLRSLTLRIPPKYVYAAASSGLKRNTTLRELTLEFYRGETNATNATDTFSIFANLRDHPLLRKLCLRGHVKDLTGLESVLLSETSKITELDINMNYGSPPPKGLMRVFEALARHPKLTKLGLRPLGHDEARLLQVALCDMPSLQRLDLARSNLGSAKFAELAPALYHNTSIKELNISLNNLNDMGSAEILRDIIRRNKTITTLNLSSNHFGRIVECIADGLGSNSTVLKIDLSNCGLGDVDVSILAQKLGSRNTTLEKLNLANNSITFVGVGVLLETMAHRSKRITELDLQNNPIGDEGASLLARSLGKNALPHLTRLSISRCDIRHDGFTALVSALEQNTSLLHLDLRYQYGYSFSERAFLALAASLPKIKFLQQLDFVWCDSLGSAMPLLLAGLRINTSLFRFHVTDYAPRSAPPTSEEAARCDGGWMQEMEGLGYRNRCLTLIRAPNETLPPLGVWPHALARVTTNPDIIFEVLRSKPSLVSSGMNKTGIRSLLELRSQGLLRSPLAAGFESHGKVRRGWLRLKIREIRKRTFLRASSAATRES
jgi:Ran GTPase-activating protein (RanGAP) involved in mRNA processing and transport